MYLPRLKAEVDNITSSEFNNCFILFLSKKYTTTRISIVWGLLCLLGMVFDTETTNSNFFWINFGYVAGHIAALIIMSIQHQLQTNEKRPYPAKVREKIRIYIQREGKDKTCFCRFICRVRGKPREIDRSLRGFPECSIWCTPTEIPRPANKKLV